MSTEKRQYSCFECGHRIVAEIKGRGTVPHVLNCTQPNCSSLMKNDYAGAVNLAGRKATHQLVVNPEGKTDKLMLKKLEEV